MQTPIFLYKSLCLTCEMPTNLFKLQDLSVVIEIIEWLQILIRKKIPSVSEKLPSSSRNRTYKCNMVPFASPKNNDVFSFSYSEKTNHFLILEYLQLGQYWLSGIRETHQNLTDLLGLKNLDGFEHCSKGGYIKIQIAGVSNTKEGNNHLVLRWHAVSTKMHITFVFLLHGFCGGLLRLDIVFKWVSYYIIFARTVRYPWVQLVWFKNKWTLRFNPFLQPMRVHSKLACESTVMIYPLSI